MPTQAQMLEQRKPGETITLYMHPGALVFHIIKSWVPAGLITLAFVFLETVWKTMPGTVDNIGRYGCMLLWLIAVIHAAKAILNYYNTYLQINDNALTYRRGWVPSYTDSILWVNIKDVNTSTRLGETVLRSGTLILMVVIRTEAYTVQIPYLPQHEDIAGYILDRISAQTVATRQITYT